MNHCTKCGADFEGNFCPHCGTRVEEELTACPRCGARRGEGTQFCANCGFSYEKKDGSAAVAAVRRKMAGGGAFVKAHKKPFLLGAVGLLLAVVLLIVLITNLSNIFRPSKVNNLSIGDTQEQVIKQLGDPNGEEGELVWYGKAYTKLAKQIEEKENSLEFCDSEAEIEKITGELEALYEKMDSLVYPYIEVKLDGEDKVSSVVYDAAYSEGDEAAEKTVKKVKVLSPGFVAYLGDPLAVEYTVEVYYQDGSYRLGKLRAKEAAPEGDKEYTLSFENKWGEYKAQIKVGSQIPAGTEVKGTFGEGGTYTLTALADGDKVSLPPFSLEIAGSGTVGAASDMPWARFPLRDVTVGGSLAVGTGAFRDCGTLSTVTIGGGVTSVGSDAFRNCSALATVAFENPYAWWGGETEFSLTDPAANVGHLVPDATGTTLTRESGRHTGWACISTTATCTAAGTETYECTRCHETKQEATPALGHGDWSLLPGTNTATCTAAGTETYECTRCHETKQEATAAYKHGWSLVSTTATCTEAGTETYECTRCHETKQEATPALGHVGARNENCSRCGAVIQAYIRCDKDNTPNASGKYLLFGEYPQTLKADSVTVTKTTDSRGYYLGSDGCWYAQVTATPYGSGYRFSTGTTVTSGRAYYFKVEPIRWRILTEESGKAFLLCDSIIVNHRYDDDSNNYANSEIRAWLNEEFYNTAFSEMQQELILVTNVDNSAASTGDSSNRYACANTSDRVFLLSVEEVTNSAYGFSSDYATYDTARRMQTSDYARAKGAQMSTDSSYYGNGWWWLRSPYDSSSSNARDVRNSGRADYGNGVNSTSGGYVPALWISL